MQGKFTKVVPMAARSEAGKSLIDLTDDVGIPETLVTDGASEFTGKNTNFCETSMMHANAFTQDRTGKEESKPSGRARNRFSI